MSEEVITKRLHVSGLTPAIRPEDLSQKLGSFGTIRALDGFGQVDGLDQPRKFGYVTIETTKAKLARCMNLLSGVTWKGAKLRIGEAKPDFRDRLAQERAKMKEEEEGPPRKRRRLPRGVQGVHAADMSLVTPENVQSHPGWRVTSTGRMIRPVRMRPDHPLPDTLLSTSQAASKEKKRTFKSKNKVKLAPTRARRRTIDPTKWGSVHLKGIFLENAATTVQKALVHDLPLTVEEEGEGESETSRSEDDGNVTDEISAEDEQVTPQDAQIAYPEAVEEAPTPAVFAQPLPRTQSSTTEAVLMEEKKASLGLLQSLFGSRDKWEAEESLDSDMEIDTSKVPAGMAGTQSTGDDIEEVPMDSEPQHPLDAVASDDAIVTSEAAPSSQVASAQSQSVNLKELFAPRDEGGGFSLLGHLDLDLDLDDDVLGTSLVPVAPVSTTTQEVPLAATTIQSSRTRAQFTFDPSLPMFFPVSEEDRADSRGKVKDPFDVALGKGWDWKQFCRTQTSEQIRQRWEDQKVELTREWKRRHREAVKSRRRRGGGDGE